MSYMGQWEPQRGYQDGDIVLSPVPLNKRPGRVRRFLTRFFPGLAPKVRLLEPQLFICVGGEKGK